MEVLDVKAIFASEQQSVSPSIADLTIDVGNLLVFNYQEQPSGMEEIKKQAELCVQNLFEKVFNLPSTKSDVGALATLPPPTTRTPREKPIPTTKPETKWEKFAKEKGIKRKKRDSKVFDPVSNDFKPRWGKNRVLDPVADNWVAEDKPELLKKYGASDPFELAAKGKKERVGKQNKRELANKKRASQKSSSIPLNLELHHAPRREVSAIHNALQQTQKSTASMGHFDQLHSDEPKIKRKPKFMPARVEDEKALSMKIANRILRDTPEIDTTKATNLAIQKEQRESSGKRPTKRRRQ
eukprot:TRINITY_DN1219_c0_g2_i1.p1 TRINITY_DN1219_c0_g2~~TRINITY_DN1219_c0_g2_i1.p1  ORF type:complete len:297 (-),score=68.91 TRINITY_DN1219_c0_g2_i1:112-1002(-)